MRNLTRVSLRSSRLPFATVPTQPDRTRGDNAFYHSTDARVLSCTCVDASSGRVWATAEVVDGESEEKEVEVWMWDRDAASQTGTQDTQVSSSHVA